MGRSWGIKATMLTRHITGTSAHFIGKSHTKSSKKSVHPLLTRPTAHQNEGLSRGRWERLAKTEAWAIGRSEPALRLRLGPAADSRLRLASGSWAGLGNHYVHYYKGAKCLHTLCSYQEVSLCLVSQVTLRSSTFVSSIDSLAKSHAFPTSHILPKSGIWL